MVKSTHSKPDIKRRLGARPGAAPIHAGAATQTLRGTSSESPAPRPEAKEQKEKEFIRSIKSKKGLETLDDEFVRQKVDKIFSANHKLKAKFDASKDFAQFSRSKEYEELLKRIRKELRAIYGVFQVSGRERVLEQLRATKDEREREKLVLMVLESHQSTKERIPYYGQIYEEICKRIWPKVVVDLGCGMNPLAYRHFTERGAHPHIVASDISATDMAFLRDAFKILQIPGEAVPLDLTKDYEKLDAMNGDVTFLFKLLDSLEEAHRHISYRIFEHIRTPWIVASFPTKSLGGRKTIARAGRAWFERLLSRKGLQWETFSVENELFYLIRNTQ